MENLFKGIYRDYDNYQAIVARILGKDNPYIDDVISDCVLKIVEYINSDRVAIEDIIYKGTDGINASWFKITLTRQALDFKKSKIVRDTTYITEGLKDTDKYNDYQPELSLLPNTQTNIDIISFINERLDYLAGENVHHKFHADLFKICFYDEMNASQVQRDIGISRHLVRRSLNFTKDKLKQWLKENQDQTKA